MRSSHSLAGLTIVATVLLVPLAHAGNYPSGGYSSVSTPMIACPAGDAPFHVLARDYMNRPMPFWDVHLDFQRCPTVRFAVPAAGEGYRRYPEGPTPTRLIGTTDAGAEMTLGIRAGGSSPALVVLYINWIVLTERHFVSPDQDGDLVVTAGDVTLAEAKLGTADPTADFDGDGTVTAADLTILNAHLGHHAPDKSTPVASRSWGTLKLLYR
jgi:dockerin type I repeat protein